MSHQTIFPPENRLLRALPASDFALLRGQLEPVCLPLRTQLEAPHQKIQYAYFIESGIASTVAKTPSGREAEIGIVGREGMTGSALLQGNDQGPYDCFMQVEGAGLRIATSDLLDAVSQSAVLRSLLTRFARALTIQACYTALANGHSKLEERLARWLLMVHDRIEGDRLEITHEFLALMLAVRRPGVTVALHILEGKGLIRSNRAEIVINDREGLIALGDGVYSLPEQEYTRLIGSDFAKHRLRASALTPRR